MTYLVTGSTGFIGRRLVSRLVAHAGAPSVICLSKAPAATLHAQRAMGVRVITADLLDQPIGDEPPPAIDVVFHLAANAETAATDDELRVNHVGTRHLLDWLLASPAACPRIVYASSVAVHDRERAPDGPIRESSPLVPRTAYGRTKLAGEAVVRAFGDSGRCSWTILRLPTVYGAGQKPNGLFETLHTLTANGHWLGRITWPGRTSIMHVDDVVDAMIDLGHRPAAAGEVYCLDSEEALTVGEIAQEIARSQGRPIDPIDIPRPIWAIARAVAWNRRCWALMPLAARTHAWRFSLMISDGFLVDAAKFRGVRAKPARTLPEGLDFERGLRE